MKRWLAILAVMGTWTALGVPTASAQLGTYNPPQTLPGPSFSPYLNMIRNNPAVNYFGITQPQMQTYGTLQQLQQDVRYGGQTGQAAALGMTNQAITNNAVITGHPVMFGYTAQFFPASGSQLAGMGQGLTVGGLGAGIGNTGIGAGIGAGGIGTGGFGVGTGVGGAGPTILAPLPLGTMPR